MENNFKTLLERREKLCKDLEALRAEFGGVAGLLATKGKTLAALEWTKHHVAYVYDLQYTTRHLLELAEKIEHTKEHIRDIDDFMADNSN